MPGTLQREYEDADRATQGRRRRYGVKLHRRIAPRHFLRSPKAMRRVVDVL